jgi:hypothetical protein
MEARGAGDLARMQQPLRGVQHSQHFGRRSPRDRAGPLGVKVLCLEDACCRTRSWRPVHPLALANVLPSTGRQNIPASRSSQYKS